MDYKSFSTSKNKLQKTWDSVQAQKQEIENLDTFQVRSQTRTTLTKLLRVPISIEVVFKDLYRFTGVTFTNIEENAEPPELYDHDEENGTFSFKYPIFGYAVPQGEDPNETLGGTWEYQTTVGIIKTDIILKNLTDDMVLHSKITTQISTPGGDSAVIPELRTLIDPVSEIYAEYNEFHKWVKQTNQYKLQYFVFFPKPEEIDLNINAELLIYAPGNYNEIQKYEI